MFLANFSLTTRLQALCWLHTTISYNPVGLTSLGAELLKYTPAASRGDLGLEST